MDEPYRDGASPKRPWMPWPVEGLGAAADAVTPRPVDSAVYVDLLQPAWTRLLESEEARTEAVIQDFLERHPCLIPGAFSVDGTSGHGPWPSAVITQPVLPGLSSKFPDFMWIATDSQSTYPILIEIETPHSRWWHSIGTEVHSDLSHAQGQLAEWRAWFAQPTNQIAFADYYNLPSFFRRRKLEPRFVLIHGRRSETGEDKARLAKRAELARQDERLMTFDRLSVEVKSVEFELCVRNTPSGYKLHRAPPTFKPLYLFDKDYSAITGWDDGLAETQDLPGERAGCILQEVEMIAKEARERSRMSRTAARPATESPET